MTRSEQTGRAEWRALMEAAHPSARRRHSPPMDALRVDVWLKREDVVRLDEQLHRLALRTGRRFTRSELVRLSVTSWLNALAAVSTPDLAAIWARTLLTGCRHSVPGRRPSCAARSARRLPARSRSHK